MIAVILAAGASLRLRPLTDHTPKCLLPVGGTTLLERTLRSLPAGRIRRAVIVVGYHAGAVRTFVGTLALPFPVTFVGNPLYAETNNNASLWRAAAECAGHDILLMDSDILFHPALITTLLEAPHPNALLLRESQDLGDEEIKVAVDDTDRVLAIGKEVPASRAAGESIGIEKFSSPAASALFGILARRHALNEFYERSFQELIDSGTAIHAVPCGLLPCMEVDTESDLRNANTLAGTIDT
jgi:choline kinase